mmetsp:Transcript_55766/g.146677  ORF Transcript_55766/g.146677 Transcript_55766/m.146677 type:complete len:270 (-) Transcript_55766:1692-2501(-)
MLAEQPELLPSLRGQRKVLLRVLLVVHAAAPVDVLARLACVVSQDRLVVRGRRLLGFRLLVLMKLLHGGDRLVDLRVAVVDELRQQLDEAVVAHAPGEFCQDLAVLLVLQGEVEEVHHGDAQLVLVPVGKVVVAHDSLLHGDEDVDEARDQVLSDGRLIELLLPGGEREAEAMHELHRAAPQRRVPDVLVGRHDNAECREDRRGVEVHVETRGNAASLLLPVAVEVAEVDDVLQNRARHRVPHGRRGGRRQRLLPLRSRVHEEAEGEVH